ncbi:hypothetical protein LJ739_01390 [Aestuariibacter halophilus]|uniref:Uncharacterized protein n=1 Tax=Fluctibacter halophilus TaxID=226011 RepID=A0ABS8G437_9ALTE|nr:hypothetical protein [Aestuariibacter halophilus]MCC2614891.1 hypothetical protein [Aestuariibacter halophilus]
MVTGPAKYQVGAFALFPQQNGNDSFLQWTSTSGAKFSIHFNSFHPTAAVSIDADVQASVKRIEGTTYAYTEWIWRRGLKAFRYSPILSRNREEVACQQMDSKKMVCISIYDTGMPFTLSHTYGSVDIDSFNPVSEHKETRYQLLEFRYPYTLIFQYPD